MIKKFKIIYPKDYYDVEKRGQPYEPPSKGLVIMNGAGLFFLYIDRNPYPLVKKLDTVLPKYEVIWE